MSETTHIIKHITSCRICGQQFSNWQMDIPILGQPVGNRARQFVTALAGHLNKKHGDKMKAIQIGGQEFMGMLIMMLFNTSDPNLLSTIEQARGMVATVARKVPVSDAQIEEMIQDAPPEIQPSDELYELLYALRDRCCELGKYAPAMPTLPTPA